MIFQYIFVLILNNIAFKANVILVISLLLKSLNYAHYIKRSNHHTQKYREALGLLPHTHVEFECIGNELHIKKAKQIVRGERIVETMTGKSTVSMSTDEIMKLMRGE